eukprot:evm.model.scf_2161.1 EVM.evm.TU.scf_2161.1   scf_2161:6403-12779(+)
MAKSCSVVLGVAPTEVAPVQPRRDGKALGLGFSGVEDGDDDDDFFKEFAVDDLESEDDAVATKPQAMAQSAADTENTGMDAMTEDISSKPSAEVDAAGDLLGEVSTSNVGLALGEGEDADMLDDVKALGHNSVTLRSPEAMDTEMCNNGDAPAVSSDIHTPVVSSSPQATVTTLDTQDHVASSGAHAGAPLAKTCPLEICDNNVEAAAGGEPKIKRDVAMHSDSSVKDTLSGGACDDQSAPLDNASTGPGEITDVGGENLNEKTVDDMLLDADDAGAGEAAAEQAPSLKAPRKFSAVNGEVEIREEPTDAVMGEMSQQEQVEVEVDNPGNQVATGNAKQDIFAKPTESEQQHSEEEALQQQKLLPSKPLDAGAPPAGEHSPSIQAPHILPSESIRDTVNAIHQPDVRQAACQELLVQPQAPQDAIGKPVMPTHAAPQNTGQLDLVSNQVCEGSVQAPTETQQCGQSAAEETSRPGSASSPLKEASVDRNTQFSVLRSGSILKTKATAAATEGAVTVAAHRVSIPTPSIAQPLTLRSPAVTAHSAIVREPSLRIRAPTFRAAFHHGPPAASAPAPAQPAAYVQGRTGSVGEVQMQQQQDVSREDNKEARRPGALRLSSFASMLKVNRSRPWTNAPLLRLSHGSQPTAGAERDPTACVDLACRLPPPGHPPECAQEGANSDHERRKPPTPGAPNEANAAFLARIAPRPSDVMNASTTPNVPAAGCGAGHLTHTACSSGPPHIGAPSHAQTTPRITTAASLADPQGNGGNETHEALQEVNVHGVASPVHHHMNVGEEVESGMNCNPVERPDTGKYEAAGGSLVPDYMEVTKSLEAMLLEAQELSDQLLEMRVRTAIVGNRVSRLNSPIIHKKLRVLNERAEGALERAKPGCRQVSK